MELPQEDKITKGEVVLCEHCKKPFGTGECSRCIGIRLLKREEIHLAA